MANKIPVPDGIAILSVLNVTAGIGFVLLALFAKAFSNIRLLIGSVFWMFPALGNLTVFFLIMLGAVFIFAAFGLYTGKWWAWWLSFIVCCISVPIAIGSQNILLTIADLIMIPYLLKLTTQLYFSITDFPVSW